MKGPDEIFDNDPDVEFLSEDAEEPYDDQEKNVSLKYDDVDDYEFIDDSLNDIDFSEFKGDFKSSLRQLHGKLKHHKPRVKKIKKKKPLSKEHGISGSAIIHGNHTEKTTKRILVPRDREVIVQSVDNFMLDNSSEANSYKNIGYYKGKKLKELLIQFNNNSGVDFNLELFNPSMPLDYLFSTSGNLNNKIQIAAGNTASYTDVLYYLLANPTIIPNAKIIVSGPQILQQQQLAMQFKDKTIAGEQVVFPLSIPQNLDTMQFQSTTIAFDILGTLGKMYIPDGMDVINYTILAGNTVTFCFYYKQKLLKKLLWEEARDRTKKIII